MNSRILWSRILKAVGGIAMLLGTLDPLEGSLLILSGSGLVALGMYLSGKDGRTVLYWVWAFILIAVGVGAMFALSAVGGIGGRSGHSVWWGVLMLPYPAGWLMAVAGGVAGLVRYFKGRGKEVHA
ncbi:MAG: hypothetical protein NT154_17855 [Verrucomicrobia bacterium]|nr:hypothetical protein [Verrucomicrobiota bacterium]